MMGQSNGLSCRKGLSLAFSRFALGFIFLLSILFRSNHQKNQNTASYN